MILLPLVFTTLGGGKMSDTVDPRHEQQDAKAPVVRIFGQTKPTHEVMNTLLMSSNSWGVGWDGGKDISKRLLWILVQMKL